VVDGAPVRLNARDLILFPHGGPHVVSSALGMRAPPNAAGYFERIPQRRPFALHLEAHEVSLGPFPASGGLVPMRTEGGSLTESVLLPMILGGRRPGVRMPLAHLGEHSDEILAALPSRRGARPRSPK